jgi:diacylglycerol kinase (ATP)
VSALRWIFFINPEARGGGTRRRLEFLRARLGRAFPEASILVPDSPQGFISAVTRGSREADRLVALGGDGTFSHALNGLLAGDPSRAALGFIHHGRGGDFQRSTGTPRRLDLALLRLRESRPAVTDCGRITTSAGTRHFLNVASVGLSGQVDRFVRRHSWPLPATVFYFLASLSESLRYRCPRLSIEMDGGVIFRKFLVVAAANGNYFGGRMHISPESDLRDGRLNLVGLPGWRHPRLLHLSTLVYAGRHLRHPEVLHRTFTRARITSGEERPIPIDVDGEEFGALPAEIEVVPKAFQLLA